ncbi:putative sulfate exporter family transporter [Anaerosalibacter bizertensis]|uniref:Sulfate exporter family transporter n=2 Tax=Bacillota TaxID=1239 RepID=A0A844FFQ5_9FIRM|nr:putative sulfate exporter family transporter [Anaerosalibacter bizertensis]MBV1819054.1 putative sulfate exporter family transporter [Bacteroidales bacterium MSK.15.36]MCB5560068.1 putative sulfate exporter family transporter [Anaerosalibacter bizertensis]MCG4565193.1 putative sulfate exporter family transporter [Anaerosalibacter bizertensis]MCG4582903.1 putative sulfate exporter family transporter [Anaerosalibacter bizertensis]MCG4585269.1 putative sulfate exporter family transporter [Anae
MLLGIGVCVIIAFLATYLGGLQRIIGGPMIGLFIGMLVANIKPPEGDFKNGTTFAAKKFLNLGIIVTGATLSFKEIVGFGASALPLIIFNIALALGIAYLIGGKLGVSKNTRTLVGGGTSICGGTAIATLASIIEAKEEEMAYALTAIFLFDIIAALGFPYLGRALALSPEQFGVLAGTAINDTSSVVAAADTFDKLLGDLSMSTSGLTGGNLAVIVKLTRTTMLVVLAIIFTFVTINKKRKSLVAQGNNGSSSINHESNESVGKVVLRVFPWFILIFIIMALLNTIGVFPESTAPFIKKLSKFLVTTALAGVGFKINFKDLFTKGIKPIMLGGCTWLGLCISSMTYIFLIMPK